MAQAGSKIKPIIADRLGHRVRHQVIDGQARFHPRANLRGGNPQRKARQPPPAKWRGKRRLRLPGPGNDHKLHQPRQLLRRAPLRQLRQVIRANQVEKLRLGKRPA